VRNGTCAFLADFKCGAGRTDARLIKVGAANFVTLVLRCVVRFSARHGAAEVFFAFGSELADADCPGVKFNGCALPPILAPNLTPALTTALVLILAPTKPEGTENLSTFFFAVGPLFGAALAHEAAGAPTGGPFVVAQED